jgi:hypothetical protein
MIKFILEGSIDVDNIDIKEAKLTHGELGLEAKPPLLTLSLGDLKLTI